MMVRALLLGEGKGLPFSGHFRFTLPFRGGSFSVSGRVAALADLEQAFTVAHRVRVAIQTGVEAEAGGERGIIHDDPLAVDRHRLIHRTWMELGRIPEDDLGPLGGSDLTMLIAASDTRGTAITGVGLAGVWAQIDGATGLQAVVPPNHPLLSSPGRPERFPGVLNLDIIPLSIIGAPSHHVALAPMASQVTRRCGVRA
jgi:hypothetical protein